MGRIFEKSALAFVAAFYCLGGTALSQIEGQIEAEPPSDLAVDAAPEAAIEPSPVPPVPVRKANYLMMPPQAKIMFITTGGAELRADWTETAKTHFANHTVAGFESAGKTIAHFDPASVEADAELRQLLLLWDVVAASTGTPMPHKGKKFDSNQKLTLGPSASRLADTYGAEKAVFVDHYSQIESGGVFLAQVMIGAATGYVPASANVRATTLRVVDLRTGDIISTGTVIGGDARDLEESKGITSRMMKSLDLD